MLTLLFHFSPILSHECALYDLRILIPTCLPVFSVTGLNEHKAVPLLGTMEEEWAPAAGWPGASYLLPLVLVFSSIK